MAVLQVALVEHMMAGRKVRCQAAKRQLMALVKYMLAGRKVRCQAARGQLMPTV